MSSFKEELRTLPSVAGIVHTAMVLRDEFLKDLTFEAFTEVMGPKIKGKITNYCDGPGFPYSERKVLAFSLVESYDKCLLGSIPMSNKARSSRFFSFF